MRIFAIIGLCGFMAFTAYPALAADIPGTVPERVLGKTDAPVTVEEFISLTCPHCADFYVNTLPQLEKQYVDTGKVKFILRDFPLDGVSLKAAALARCMPADEFYPFISVLYKNQGSWAFAADPDKVLIQYASLGGLAEDKAKECLADTKMQDALIAGRTGAQKKYDIQATPTFVINGTDQIKGAQPADVFAAEFDKFLGHKK